MSTEAERGTIDRVERRLDDLFRLVGDVRERLARMEGEAVHTQVTELRAQLVVAHQRIDALEATRNQHIGQSTATKTWAEWIHRLSPWLFATGLVVWNYFKLPA
jgi:hypothetical protein